MAEEQQEDQWQLAFHGPRRARRIYPEDRTGPAREGRGQLRVCGGERGRGHHQGLRQVGGPHRRSQLLAERVSILPDRAQDKSRRDRPHCLTGVRRQGQPGPQHNLV